jgi:hypothetical protein
MRWLFPEYFDIPIVLGCLKRNPGAGLASRLQVLPSHRPSTDGSYIQSTLGLLQDLRRIQAAISTMVVSGELLTGIQAANFRICAVTVTNFDLLPAPLPPPPAEAPSASPNIYSSRQSSRELSASLPGVLQI